MVWVKQNKISVCVHWECFFFQWRDNKQVYGLNFSSKDDADVFANAMIRALEVIQKNYLIVNCGIMDNLDYFYELGDLISLSKVKL